MATQPATKYPNNSRTITGTGNVIKTDDVELLCDTTSGAVSLVLNELIPGKWNTVYKIYVIDSGNNAATNNITITVPSGYKINNTTSLVIDSNGGGAIIRVLNDTNYLGDVNYNSTVPSQDYDTGWINLTGFGHMSSPPQYRVINRLVMFRGFAVVPLSNGASVIPYVTENDYIDSPFNTPWTGGGTGSAGTFTTPSAPHFVLGFNSSGIDNPANDISSLPSVIGNSNRNPDNRVYRRDIMAYRRVRAQGSTTRGVVYNVPIGIFIQSNGSMLIQLVNDYEDGDWSNAVKTDSRRILGTNATAGQYYSDLGAINMGNATPSTDIISKGISDPTDKHAITVDITNANTLGGFQINLDGITYTISRSIPLTTIHA